MTELSLLIPVPGPEITPVSYALTAGEAEPGPDDWHDARWEEHMVRVSGPRPAPGRYVIWIRTDRLLRDGQLEVTAQA
jgi:hypothetical protein